MCDITIDEKRSMIRHRLAFILDELQKIYGISPDRAYAWLIKSKTYDVLTNTSDDAFLYYKAKEFIMDLVRAEYENRLNDWKYIISI